MSSENKNTKNTVSGSSKVNAGGNVHIGDIINIHQVQKETPLIQGKLNAETAKNIRNLIKRSKVKDALEELLKISETTDADLHDQIISQSERWNKLQKDERLGILSSSEGSVIRNRIVYNLLGFVTEMEASEK